jgi:hypothetical protein
MPRAARLGQWLLPTQMQTTMPRSQPHSAPQLSAQARLCLPWVRCPISQHSVQQQRPPQLSQVLPLQGMQKLKMAHSNHPAQAAAAPVSGAALHVSCRPGELLRSAAMACWQAGALAARLGGVARRQGTSPAAARLAATQACLLDTNAQVLGPVLACTSRCLEQEQLRLGRQA